MRVTIFGKAGNSVAVLSVFKEDNEPRKVVGSWEGKIKPSDDFDITSEKQ